MVIEWLRVKVAPELRERYIQKDGEIWTSFLAEYPGFLGKQVWINPNNPSEVILVIHWESREAWKSVPASRLEAIDQEFIRQLGGTYEFLEEAEYHIRKFSPAD
jgi:uncharacterized protein (TIGR03792 family)